jgi:hypothetical protein
MNSVQQDVDARADALAARIDAVDEAVRRGCRHCGQPVELGIDGALLRAPLEPGETPHVYAAHLVCQVRALEALAEANHEAVAHWRLTPAGAALLKGEGDVGSRR